MPRKGLIIIMRALEAKPKTCMERRMVMNYETKSIDCWYRD